jgi:carboxymethylenebutenolidase
MYDRREPGFLAKHDPDGIKAGVAHAMGTPQDQAMGDIAACAAFLRTRGSKVCIVGYCYGGSLAWLAASRVEGLAAASSYYGSMVQANAAQALKCPAIVHLGRTDHGIPADEVAAAIGEHHPDTPVYIYEGAGHGFNNESPERYNAEAADLARHRTLELFDRA